MTHGRSGSEASIGVALPPAGTVAMSCPFTAIVTATVVPFVTLSASADAATVAIGAAGLVAIGD